MIKAHQRHSLWLSFWLQRVSGLLLACFLPLHFWVLSLTLKHQHQLDQLLSWTHHPWVKTAEFSLIFLLTVHFLGGLRVLTLELLPWPKRQKRLATLAILLSIYVAGLFLLNAYT